jgi:flagellar motor component MotA
MGSEVTQMPKKSDYKSLLAMVSTLIEEARREAVKQVNHTFFL